MKTVVDTVIFVSVRILRCPKNNFASYLKSENDALKSRWMNVDLNLRDKYDTIP